LLAFAVVEVFTGLARTFELFILVRALFGIVMGGQWGVGASLAMEKVPIRFRGVLSGLLQEGYAVGYLFAAAAYFFIYDRFSWRPLFFLGPLPALAMAAFVAFKVRESAVWKRTQQKNWQGLWQSLSKHWKLLAYVTFFMMTMHMTSHGTQDLYPTFLSAGGEFGLESELSSPRSPWWAASRALSRSVHFPAGLVVGVPS
jgi:MFS transporter, SHS family, lactate transporter